MCPFLGPRDNKLPTTCTLKEKFAEMGEGPDERTADDGEWHLKNVALPPPLLVNLLGWKKERKE